MEPENESTIQKNKKEIIIIIIIVVIFLITIGILFFFKNKNQSNQAGGTIPNKVASGSIYANNANNQSLPPDQNVANSDNSNITYYSEGLIKIWDKPVAGYGLYKKNTSYTYLDSAGNTLKGNKVDNILIFVDSNTGFIYQKNLSEATSTPIQITKSSYPNIIEAYFLNINGQEKVILQYSANNTIKSVLANIGDYYTTPNNLENITNLDNNITSVSISPDLSQAVYIINKNKITNNKKDVYSDWYLINSSGINKIYTSELSSWKLQITNSGDIYTYNNDTSIEKSNLYKLDNVNKVLNLINPGHTGSSYLINDNNVLTSAFTSSGIKIYFDQNFYGSYFSDNNLTSLNFNTLSNKCYMGSIIICGVPKEIKNYDTGLPDAWYQGLTSFEDNIYVVNSDYPLGQLLFDLNIDGGVADSFDLKDIKVTDNEDHVLFINKNDGSLWSINTGNILKVSTGD